MLLAIGIVLHNAKFLAHMIFTVFVHWPRTAKLSSARFCHSLAVANVTDLDLLKSVSQNVLKYQSTKNCASKFWYYTVFP